MVDESGERSPRQVPGRQSGRFGVALAVILSLVALAAVAFLLYRDVYLNPLEDLSAALQSVRDASAEQRTQIETGIAALESRLSRRLDAQQDRLDAAEGRLSRLQLEAAERRPDELAWRLVEAEYLLRVANHRGRLDGDAEGARALLVAAEAVLAESDDAALAELRAAVAEGIRLLDGVQPIDARRIHGELEDMQRRIETLPFRLPEFEPAPPAGADTPPQATDATATPPGTDDTEPATGAAEGEPAGGAWQRTLGRLGSLFDFRRRDVTAPPPILRPDEERFLQMNLALAIEEAQVALARRDDAMFDASLATVLETIGRFMDTADDRVIEVRQHLEQLRALDVGAPLPDFSRALTLLQRRGVAPALAEPAAEAGPVTSAPAAFDAAAAEEPDSSPSRTDASEGEVPEAATAQPEAPQTGAAGGEAVP